MRIYNIFGRLARTHYRNRATASTACPPNATCCPIDLPFPHKCLGCSPLIALFQSRLAANGSTSPYDRQKDRTFPHPEAHSVPFMEMLASTAGLSLKNSPTFSEKRGEISKKSPIFYFTSPAIRSKQPRKNRNSPTKS